jgi:hypothetical protein
MVAQLALEREQVLFRVQLEAEGVDRIALVAAAGAVLPPQRLKRVELVGPITSRHARPGRQRCSS